MHFVFQIITNFENIAISNSNLYLNSKPIFGIFLVCVLCPQDLLYPFLQYRDSYTGRVSTPVCRTCAESQQAENCLHSIRY